MNRPVMLGALALSLSAFSCSGARSYVVAPHAEVPISMSTGLRGADGHLLSREEKHVVGQFSMDYKTWGMWWTIISFTGDKDISAEVNKQVKDAGGDAIANLEVRSGLCMWSVITFIGLLPDCANVEIRGDIIKTTPLTSRLPPAPPPAGGAAAPAPATPTPAPPPAAPLPGASAT